MTQFHHGVTATEVTQGILPMRNADTSTIGLICISDDADEAHYPKDTPVLLTGITQDDLDKAGKTGTLYASLYTIRAITNPTVVVLRVSNPSDTAALDVLLNCQSRLGITPKILGAPQLDTPSVVRKLVAIAKRRRGFVYASCRRDDGTLITDKTEIVAYRNTFGDRELMLIDNQWGEDVVIAQTPAQPPTPSPVQPPSDDAADDDVTDTAGDTTPPSDDTDSRAPNDDTTSASYIMP